MIARNMGLVDSDTLSQSSFFVNGITATTGLPRFVTTMGSRMPFRA